MAVETHIDDAIERASDERAVIADKRDAIAQFTERVAELSPASEATATPAIATTGGLAEGSDAGDSRCRTVRQAFAETVYPHALDEIEGTESVHAAIGNELSEELAVALAPATDAAFSATLKQALVSEAESRRTETAVLVRALEREVEQLQQAGAVVEEVTGWIDEAEETPLTELGFDALHARHERLADYRDRCETVVSERQAFLDGTTNTGADVGVSHRLFPSYLYQSFPDEHPALATVARLDSTCESCQRAVRAHLTRRA
ncbi:DUF7260 family protein [Halosegnis longus]|uniref:DUF7260 domain-containing protein n=1 Tax=Halosegnis longus TaxID=2216012 RepID=A0AAJ4R896_9EURY|nr:hypothetical protein [Salella cibi]RNJ26020.1 hypothetical protein Nmn1133_04520 [Salella cibi]